MKLGQHFIVTLVTFMCIWNLFCNVTYALSEGRFEKRPFWAEKSSYVEGEFLYVVGVATYKGSLEESRQDAFDNGVIEIMNYSQISDVTKIRGLIIDTQMTYQENVNSTWTVFRLMKVRLNDLSEIRQRLLDTSIKIVADQNEELHLKTETLQKELVKRESLEARRKEIQEKVTRLTKTAIENIKCGMTLAEVEYIMGPPRAKENYGIYSDKVYYNYGTVWIYAEDGIVRCINTGVDFIKKGYCAPILGDFCP